MTETALYRFFDENDSLLYVGITHRLNERLSAHKKEKAWDEVSRITLEHYPAREMAADAEVRAIRTEKPRWNVVHTPRRNGPRHNLADSEMWTGDDEVRLRYLRFKAWPDLGRFYPDGCPNCHRFSDEGLVGETLAELRAQEFGFVRAFTRRLDGSITVEYRCPRCRHVWDCTFSEDFPLWLGAEGSVLSWLLSLFPRGTAWEKDDVWLSL